MMITLVKIVFVFRSENIRHHSPVTVTSGQMTGKKCMALCLDSTFFKFLYYINGPIHVPVYNFYH